MSRLFFQNHTSVHKLSSGKHTFSKRAGVVVLIFTAIIFLRVFAFEFYQVNSGSMEETLYEGDLILVKKFQYGARLPQKPKDIPFLEALSYLVGAYKWSQVTHWNYRRVTGTGKIKRNDIIIFDRFDSDKILVKRCTGLPGDTIRISHNHRYANNVLQQEVSTVKYSYCIKTNHPLFNLSRLKEYGVSAKDFLWQEGKKIHVSMTRKTAADLQKSKVVDTVSIDDYPEGAPGDLLFTSSPEWRPTRENYGPVFIPAKGKSIRLTKDNIRIYWEVIERYEQNQLALNGNAIFINNKKASSYTFKNNYYFVMGDNRYHSIDSRYWGFLPESAIIGKVSFTIF